MKLDVLPDVEEEITEHDGKCHYVRIAALLKGGAVVALCGKKYVPITIANATDYPVCGKCKELMELLHMMEA